MNTRYVIQQLSLLLLVVSALLLAIAGWVGLQVLLGTPHDRAAGFAFLLAALAGGVCGGFMLVFWRPQSKILGRREALLLVAMSWFIGAALAGLPFLLWAQFEPAHPAAGPFLNPANCYFESMSGLTTTGATVLVSIEELPRSILLWRAVTHWLGGLGIVVLFVAVLPSVGSGGKKLFRMEAPGPEPEGIQPHIRETARTLWLIYVGLTGAEILALKAVGMSWFDAVCHTFATLATGGFSTSDSSIGRYQSIGVYIVIIFFMLLAGVNFGLYYQLLRGRFGSVWRDTELRAYLAILVLAAAVVTVSIARQPIALTTGETVGPSWSTGIREGVFTTVSIQTTTGFCTSDFNQWPFIAKAVLVTLMFIGGSAGSTGGGIKVIRVLIAGKVMLGELERSFRPHVVRPLKIGASSISNELRLGSVAFLLGHVLLAGAGIALLRQFEPAGSLDITTAATASIATLCNVGPGLGAVGAVENYGGFTAASKLVMCLLMAIGRLEVFAVLSLFVPRFWRSG